MPSTVSQLVFTYERIVAFGSLYAFPVMKRSKDQAAVVVVTYDRVCRE